MHYIDSGNSNLTPAAVQSIVLEFNRCRHSGFVPLRLLFLQQLFRG